MKLKLYLLIIFLSCTWSGHELAAQNKKTLDYYIQTAENNSPLLNDYNNQVFSAKIDSLKLRAAYGFIISGESSAAYAPAIHGWGYDNVLSNGQSLFAGVRVVKEFISRNNLSTRLTGYNLTISQLLAQAAISRQTLKKGITDQFIATYASQQQLELAREIIHLLQQEDIVLKKLTQATVFKQTDYLNFKVNLQQNELALEQHRAEWKSNFTLLNYLCGLTDTSFQSLQAPSFPDLHIIPFESSIYSDAFIADSAKLANEAAIIHYDYKVKVSGFSDGGFQSSFALTPYKNFGTSVGVAISLPLYDGHRKQMLLNQNKIQLDTRKRYYDQARRQYDQHIFQLHTQLNQYEQMIRLANEQIVYAKTLTEANARQLPTGDVKMVDFILSISNLLNLRSSIITYNTTIYNLKNQLQYLIIQ